MDTVRLPTLLFSLSWIRKGLHHLKAWWRIHHWQFTVSQVTVQHLVGGMTYTSLIMPIRILIPTPILPPLTLFQMELQTVIQSWLEPVTSHLTKLRYFTSLDFIVKGAMSRFFCIMLKGLKTHWNNRGKREIISQLYSTVNIPQFFNFKLMALASDGQYWNRFKVE